MKKKLQEVANNLEKNKGALKLFVCVWRDDLKKWDIVISAEWIEDSKLKENIGDIFDAFKGQFNGEFALRFAGIYPLNTKEPFVEKVTSLFSVTTGATEMKQVQLGELTISEMVLIVSRP